MAPATSSSTLAALFSAKPTLLATSLINESRLGYVRSFLGYEPPLGNMPVSANLGIPNANTSTLLGGGALIGNNGSQLSYTGDYGDYFVPEDTYQLADNVSLVKGRNTFKFGVNFIWRQVNFFNPIAGKGYFQANETQPWSTGFEQSDLLVGWINDYQVGPASAMFHTRSWENGFLWPGRLSPQQPFDSQPRPALRPVYLANGAQ